jgi:hypothetical protein
MNAIKRVVQVGVLEASCLSISFLNSLGFDDPAVN